MIFRLGLLDVCRRLFSALNLLKTRDYFLHRLDYTNTMSALMML